MNNFSILVFGASFDPPHRYHIEILKSAIREIKPSKVIIIPSFLSPFKTSHFADYRHRRKMIKMLLEKNNLKFQIDDFELKKKRKTYTYELARHLKNKHKKAVFYFLMGSDSYNLIKKWKRHKEVLKTFKIIVAQRKGYEIKNKKNILILKGKFSNLSSTQIRNRILNDDYSLIDSSIKRYIKKNSLYFSKMIKDIKKIQTRKRFNHTISTTIGAIELSKIYKADTLKAAIAALLHDITKDMELSKQLKIIKRSKMKVKDLEELSVKAPQIIHQWASAGYAKLKFKIKDKEILSAISKHTTGDKKMSLLDKIIYIADIQAMDRNFKEVKMIRRLSLKSLRLAYNKAREAKMKYIRKKSGFIYE